MRLFFALFFLCFASVQAQPSTEASLLQKGHQLEKGGQYHDALQVWATAFTELDSPGLAVGREFIRLATARNLRDQYETASAIYFWGLTAEQVEPNRQALQQELAMLRPLVERSLYKQWERLLEAGDPDLYRELRLFWQQRDPTPATQYNERLIEHWERIAHAQKHFNHKQDPPYSTDDRGLAYVQYGHPDRKVDGRLNITRGEVASVCSQLRLCNSEIMPTVAMDLHTHPYYEIWMYNRPNPEMEFNLVMIFGDKARGGFGSVQTVEDFIPARAFSLSDRFNSPSPGTGANNPGEKMSPGMVLQWLYYEHFATTDFFFANRFSDLVFRWDRNPGDPSLGKHQGPVQQERSRTITLRNLKRAPPEMSTYIRELPAIPLQEFYYRLLDENNRPIAVTFLESRPAKVLWEDLSHNQEVLFPHDSTRAEETLAHYELVHGLQLIDQDGEIISRYRIPAKLALDIREELPAGSVFTIPYTGSGQNLILYAELHNHHPDSQPKAETPFSDGLRGLGKLEIELPEPLSADSGNLQMADLVLGWQMQSDAPDEVLFPFVVANDREIPEGQALAIHLEIYHLQKDGHELMDFTIDYSVRPVRRMEWLRGLDQEFSLTLHQETTEERFVENLEIQTRDLQPGRYILKLKTTDNRSGQTVEREIGFRVIERIAADIHNDNES